MKPTIIHFSSAPEKLYIAHNSKSGLISWPVVADRFPNIFSVEDVFSIHYEPATNTRLTIRNVNGENLPENNSVECAWIVSNFEALITELDSFLYEDNNDEQAPIETSDIVRISTLQNTDWYVSRHQEQVSLGLQTTLSQQQYEELLTYRQALRDLGASYNLEVTLPNAVTWPTKPTWMNA